MSPLRPSVYIRRNLGRTMPMVFVIILAVSLVASVVSIIGSIDLTVYTLYGYNKFVTGLTPRNGPVIDPDQIAKIQKLPALGIYCPTHSYTGFVKTIFGKMPFPIFGLDAPGRKLALERMGLKVTQGRLPAEGQPEAAISDEVAKNMDLKVGDVLLKPNTEDGYAPVEVRLVGLLHGAVWLGLTSKSFVDINSPETFVGALVFAKVPGRANQNRLDDAIQQVIDPKEVREWRFSGLVRETKSALANLYLIMDIVTALMVFAIAFVCGLLSNIFFTQRLPEVATLSAIGYPRRFLLARALSETALLCVLGWLSGWVVTVGLLWCVRTLTLAPRGLLLNIMDFNALRFTLPLPVAIILFALITIGLRLSTLDPVSIIERRG